MTQRSDTEVRAHLARVATSRAQVDAAAQVAHDEKVRRAERERIARAIEAHRDATVKALHPSAMVEHWATGATEAARIARMAA